MALIVAACDKPDIIPGGGDGPDPADTTQTPVTPTDSIPAKPAGRWDDTGADVPDWPTYNAVSKLADFPRVDVVTGDGRAITDKNNYKVGTITFKDPAKMYSDSTLLSVPMQIRGRGNTSWNAEGGLKNSYRVKLETKHKVFGMSGDRDWILLADVKDGTLLRNAVSQRIARLVSMPWSPRFRAVELYINGSYAGCYTLFEQKETGTSKVNVTPMHPTDTEGGFFIELDNKDDEDKYFRSAYFEKKIKFKDPDFADLAAKKLNDSSVPGAVFIMNQVNTLERLLSEEKFDKETGYWAYAEVITFVRNFIVQELTRNPDGNMRLSTYFAKDADTKLFMPMCWDFDLALGNTRSMQGEYYVDTSEPEGWWVKDYGDYPYIWEHNRPTYYQYMFRDPQFVQLLQQEWETVKPRLDKIPAFIDKMYEYDKLAFAHNDSAGFAPYISSYGGEDYNVKHYSTHDSAVKALKDFYTKRLAWMDTAIKNL